MKNGDFDKDKKKKEEEEEETETTSSNVDGVVRGPSKTRVKLGREEGGIY